MCLPLPAPAPFPLFLPGQILGTPDREEIHAMNPNYTEFKFPQIKACPWAKVFSKRMPADAVELVRCPAPCALRRPPRAHCSASCAAIQWHPAVNECRRAGC